MDTKRPLVSIVCNTYNHESFIEQCIKGFLVQQCNFPIEILIHDDASQDGTQDIINAYEKEYPHLIFPVYQKENKKSLGIQPFAYYQIPRARGKYIAVCEGDDYWTDPNKLQIQVDFMESSPEYVVCYHNAITINENGDIISGSQLPDSDKRDLSQDELIRVGCYMLTLSLLFRNVLTHFPPEYQLVKNGDDFLASLLGKHGKGKYLGEIEPAVYRIHSGGIWSSLSEKEIYRARIVTNFYMAQYYSRVGEEHHADHFRGRLYEHALNLQRVDDSAPQELTELLHSVVSSALPAQRTTLPVAENKASAQTELPQCFLCRQPFESSECTAAYDSEVCGVCAKSIPKYHRYLWSFIRRNTNIFDSSPKRILHITRGSGLETHLGKFRQLEYTRIDSDEAGAGSKASILLEKIADASFDLILCSQLSEPACSTPDLVSQLRRIVKKDGAVLFDLDPMSSEAEKTAKQHVSRARDNWLSILKQTGLNPSSFKIDQILNSSELVESKLPMGSEIVACVPG